MQLEVPTGRGVTAYCRSAEVPMINFERHKVLQILVNLIRNGKDTPSEVRETAPPIPLYV